MFRNKLIVLDELIAFIASPTQSLSSLDLDVEREAAIPSGEVVTFFTEKEYDSLVIENAGKLVVIMASLTWCRPCKRMTPVLEVRLVLTGFKSDLLHILRIYIIIIFCYYY